MKQQTNWLLSTGRVIVPTSLLLLFSYSLLGTSYSHPEAAKIALWDVALRSLDDPVRAAGLVDCACLDLAAAVAFAPNRMVRKSILRLVLPAGGFAESNLLFKTRFANPRQYALRKAYKKAALLAVGRIYTNL